jgi:hypothetical protein
MPNSTSLEAVTNKSISVTSIDSADLKNYEIHNLMKITAGHHPTILILSHKKLNNFQLET